MRRNQVMEPLRRGGGDPVRPTAIRLSHLPAGPESMTRDPGRPGSELENRPRAASEMAAEWAETVLSERLCATHELPDEVSTAPHSNLGEDGLEVVLHCVH